MRKLWAAAMVLTAILAAKAAWADTVYLKDGRSVWGSEVYEEEESVVVVRPGGTLRFPKGEVDKIEGIKRSLPPFYTPPAAPSAPGGGSAAPLEAPSGARPRVPPVAGEGSSGTEATPPTAPPLTAPPPAPPASGSGPGPIQLPPPPPPPMPGPVPGQ